MKFGICTPVENSAAAKAAGWDFVEEFIQPALQGTLPDDQWTWPERSKSARLPVLAANSMLPATMKVTGAAADLNALRDYMTCVIARAVKAGIGTLVFGSGGARKVPDDFDRDRARQQITDFLKTIAPIAKKSNVMIVVEPLHKGETNIINGVAEAMESIRAVNHPNVQCLVDSFHSWTDDEPLSDIESAIKSIKHVHVADREGRVPPGESGKADYVPLFRVLKRGGYGGVISVESPGMSEDAIKTKGSRVLAFLKDQWQRA